MVQIYSQKAHRKRVQILAIAALTPAVSGGGGSL
jgi:hypothetical protein